MFKKMLFSVLSVLILSSFVLADMGLNELMGKVQGNQEKIKDMYVETSTVINSSMSMPGQKATGPQKMTQKAKMWTKGKMSKMEMLSPQHQITINNGKKISMVNPETGQKMVQDIKGQGAGVKGQESMSLEKAQEYFNLSIAKKGNGYLITGIPKKPNQFLGKMEFLVDGATWLPTKIYMYDAKGKLMNLSNLSYQQVSGIYVPSKTTSVVTTPMGKMDVEMVYSNVKINQGLSDSIFTIQ